MKRANRAQRQAWIMDYLKEHFQADAVNQDFHEKYHAAFPEFTRRETFWGAMPVAQAMRDLADMAGAGLVESGRISLGANWQPGFPKWVRSYTLAKQPAEN